MKRLSDILKSVTAFYDGYEILCDKLTYFFIKFFFSVFSINGSTLPLPNFIIFQNDQSWYQHDFCPHAANINEPKFPSPKSKIVVNLQKTLKECERWCTLQVRRLRIQHKIKSTEKGIEDVAEDDEMPEYTSSIPLLPPMVCLTATMIGLAITQ